MVGPEEPDGNAIAYEVEVLADAGVVVLRPIGTYRAEDVHRWAQVTRSHPDARPWMHRLIDLSRFDMRHVRGDDLRDLVSLFPASGLGEHARVALLAPDDLAFGMARAYTVYAEKLRPGLRQREVFREYGEAMAWLTETSAAPPDALTDEEPADG